MSDKIDVREVMKRFISHTPEQKSIFGVLQKFLTQNYAIVQLNVSKFLVCFDCAFFVFLLYSDIFINLFHFRKVTEPFCVFYSSD